MLIVDDASFQRSFLASQLQQLGCAVVAVDCGDAALQAWARGRFGLLITDCRMPGMDGFALSSRLRQLEAEQRQASMTIVGCSACGTEQDSKMARQAGMNRILDKPLSLDTLHRLTERNLDRRRLQQLGQTAAGLLQRLEAQLAADLHRELQILYGLPAQDRAALSRCCHRLKGIACLIDAVPLAKACAGPEGGRVARLRLAIEQLLLELARSNVGSVPQFFGKFPIPAPQALL